MRWSQCFKEHLVMRTKCFCFLFANISSRLNVMEKEEEEEDVFDSGVGRVMQPPPL